LINPFTVPARSVKNFLALGRKRSPALYLLQAPHLSELPDAWSAYRNQNGVFCMPSTSDRDKGRPNESTILQTDMRAISLTESLGDRVVVLAQRRQAAYERARGHRRAGQLVPGSLDQEMAENGVQLRHALERYTEATGG
jgi:hypothetical protein